MAKEKKTTRGTDEAFLKLMKVGGSSVLKLFGIAANQADKYSFQAIVIKDKILKPDVKGFPKLTSEDGQVFIEFQGYSDPFIRQRLMAEIFLSCASEQYRGSVMAGIVYTDKKYQQAATSLNIFNHFTESADCHLNGCFQEIVLSDYTQEKLAAIDPKLVVLAPFTVAATTNKTTLLAKGQEWQKEVKQVFPTEKQGEALNVLGLFILNRFRQLSYEEVVTMLNFDLMDTLAGKQLYKMGEEKGEEKALKKAIVGVLKARFETVPNQIAKQIRDQPSKILQTLLEEASICQDIEDFKEKLLF
jgi:predicted transposase YdaD